MLLGNLDIRRFNFEVHRSFRDFGEFFELNGIWLAFTTLLPYSFISIYFSEIFNLDGPSSRRIESINDSSSLLIWRCEEKNEDYRSEKANV